jgi:hypothetical protein
VEKEMKKRTLIVLLTFTLVIGSVLAGIFLAKVFGQEVTYKTGIVQWNDAVAYTRVEMKNPDEMLADVYTIGFIKISEKTVMVIHNVSDGTPDRYTVIPRCWIKKIVWLKEDTEYKDDRQTESGGKENDARTIHPF